MPKVTFIVNSPHSPLGRLELLAKLLQQFLQRGVGCFCLTADSDYAAFLDDYLWSDPFGFLPHAQSSYATIPCQVYIGHELTQAQGCGYVFNCTDQYLGRFLDDQHVEYIEWVSNIDAEKSHMREVFRSYQSQQITPTTIRMT